MILMGRSAVERGDEGLKSGIESKKEGRDARVTEKKSDLDISPQRNTHAYANANAVYFMRYMRYTNTTCLLCVLFSSRRQLVQLTLLLR